MMFVKWFNEIQRDDIAVAGGKAINLGEMTRAGLPVPAGFVITTTAYRTFVEANNLQSRILELAGAAQADDPIAIEHASQSIRHLFDQGTIPQPIAEAIRQAYHDLFKSAIRNPQSAIAVAVRSSATAEDLPGASFAGQQDTYLNVRGDAALLEAVKRCWASLWTARAMAYRARQTPPVPPAPPGARQLREGGRGGQGGDPAAVSLAVVVQQMTPADAAGILFTANPTTGARDEMVINAGWGLGEAIVGGRVTPDLIVAEKETGKIRAITIAEKAVMTVPTVDGTTELPVIEALQRRRVLNDAQVKQLVKLGRDIERLYDVPQDIEWAMAGGQFAILQTRPITALPEPPTLWPVSDRATPTLWPVSDRATPTLWPVSDRATWELPDPKGKYMRGSIVEFLPDPLSPLFAGLITDSVSRATNQLMAELTGIENGFPEDLLTTINGYAYYNFGITNRQMLQMIIQAIRIVPEMLLGGERRWREQARPRYAETVERWSAKPLSDLTATELLTGVKEIVDRAAEHYSTLQSGIIPASTTSEILFTVFYDRLVKRAGDPPAPTFLLGYDSTPIRAEKSLFDLAMWCRSRPTLAEALVNTPTDQLVALLVARRGAGEPGSAGAGEPYADWQEWQNRFQAHLDRFGHTIYDLDFARPVPADDPAPLLDTLKFYIQGKGANPHARQQELANRREQATQAILARLSGLRRTMSLKATCFEKLLAWAQTNAPVREDGIADMGLGWPLARRMLFELGDRLVKAGAIEQPDDVFWLEVDELQGATEALDAGQIADRRSQIANRLRYAIRDTRGAIRQRKAIWQARKRVTPPPALPEHEGARFLGIDFTRWLPARASQPTGDTLEGVGASPGQVTAPACVVHGPEDFGRMKPGDVLVAGITTPAWTPLFALASAIVTDVGGPLSHSSIVAREYGIPAVLGTGMATKRIHSGQWIRVDGEAGTVTLYAVEQRIEDRR
jgi:pyruvate,water dikinase